MSRSCKSYSNKPNKSTREKCCSGNRDDSTSVIVADGYLTTHALNRSPGPAEPLVIGGRMNYMYLVVDSCMISIPNTETRNAWPDGYHSTAVFIFDLDADEIWKLRMEKDDEWDKPPVETRGTYGPKVAVP